MKPDWRWSKQDTVLATRTDAVHSKNIGTSLRRDFFDSLLSPLREPLGVLLIDDDDFDFCSCIERFDFGSGSSSKSSKSNFFLGLDTDWVLFIALIDGVCFAFSGFLMELFAGIDLVGAIDDIFDLFSVLGSGFGVLIS